MRKIKFTGDNLEDVKKFVEDFCRQWGDLGTMVSLTYYDTQQILNINYLRDNWPEVARVVVGGTIIADNDSLYYKENGGPLVLLF